MPEVATRPETAVNNTEAVHRCHVARQDLSLVGAQDRICRNSTQIEDTWVGCNSCADTDSICHVTHHSFTLRCTRQTGTSIGSDAAPLHSLHFTRYVVSKHTPTGTNPSKSPEHRDEIGAALHRCRAGRLKCGEALFPGWKPQVQMARSKKDQR